MIKQKQQQLQVPTLEQVLEHSPLTVLPDTPLIDVIALIKERQRAEGRRQKGFIPF
jgi:CBS domain-containing protein